MKEPVNLRKYVAQPVFLNLFRLWKKEAKQKIIIASAIIIVVFTGCFQHYFRTNTKTSVNEATLKLLQNPNKYFVIYFVDSRVSGLTNLSVIIDKLKGNPVELPDEHYKSLTL